MRSRRSIAFAANPQERRLWATMTPDEVQDLGISLSPLCDEFRRSCFAVLHTGKEVRGSKIYSVNDVLVHYPKFSVELLPQKESVVLHLSHIPPSTCTRGRVELVRRNLFAILRDYRHIARGVPTDPLAITAMVRAMHTDAGVLEVGDHLRDRAMVLGGHKVSAEDFCYAEETGWHLARDGCELINGAGPGIMEATFAGATAGYEEGEIFDAQCIGCTAKDIMLDESVNAYNNPLVTFPTMAMRHEGYVRPAHSIVVFPGGVGTANEVLRFLALSLHPQNRDQEFPILFVGPERSRGYFRAISDMLVQVFGMDVQEKYELMLGDAADVAAVTRERTRRARCHREDRGESGVWFSTLSFPPELQETFIVTHERVAQLNLYRGGQTPFQLAIALGNAFDAITFGDITYAGREMIQRHGPFLLHGDSDIGEVFEELLQRFVAEGRLRGRGEEGQCYQLVT